MEIRHEIKAVYQSSGFSHSGTHFLLHHYSQILMIDLKGKNTTWSSQNVKYRNGEC